MGVTASRPGNDGRDFQMGLLLGSYFGVTGGLLLSAGIPLLVYGANGPERPVKQPIVYAGIGNRSVGLTWAF
jgi:hypothetical protein